MENFLLSLSVVLPLAILMASGYFVKRIKLYDMNTHAVMNRLVFRVFLPALLFRNIYGTDLNIRVDGRIFVFATIAILLCFVLAFAVIPLIEKDNRRRGVLIQGICRSNFVIFGMPMALELGGGETGAISLLIALVVPLYNGMSVATLEIYRGERIDIRKILLGIIKNPLILSSALALVLLYFKVPLPGALNKAIGDISAIATPLALFLLGGSLEFRKVGANRRALSIGVLGKLVVVPLIAISAAVLMGFRGPDLVGLMIVFMSPSAVSSYTMAQQMGADDELAGQQVAFSTVFSVMTIFLIIFVTKTLGYI